MDGTGTDIYARQNFGGVIGMGQSPALLIVDFTKGFADPDVFGGGNIAAAVAATVPVLARARRARMPVIHTKIIYAEDGSDAGIHCLKSRRLKLLTRSNPLSDFVPELMPLAGELVIEKRLPSAFFESGLAGILHARRIDTLLIAGCTTSGCVRASTLDAMCHGFRPIVLTDCVGDRALGPHEANLFDLGQKYADLMSSHDAMAQAEQIMQVVA
ncbi:MAG: isochorismatase family protein [Lacisediminimonas sp.]|nr:isochorismatase family protein [Lacisediminimonas sp.]